MYLYSLRHLALRSMTPLDAHDYQAMVGSTVTCSLVGFCG